MNKIQYIAKTHTSKDMAKNDKKMVNSLHNIYYIETDAETVHEMLDAGLIVGRVGNTTDFLLIDIDETTVNIHQVIEKLDSSKYFVSFSSSNNPLKYHIVVKLDREITREDYDNAILEEFENIKAICCGRCDIMNLDKNAKSFYQCFYGCSVEHEEEVIYGNSRRLFKWTKKDEEPRFYIDKEIKQHPSLNSADYCKKHNLLTVKEEKRFDIILPSMTNGKLKMIDEGHRYNWARMTGTKLLMRILYLNHQFNEGWTKWDFLDTFDWIIRTNVVKFSTFDEAKSLSLWLDTKWDIMANKTFEEQCELLEPYFDSSKRQYKSRKYNATVMSEIIMEHQFDETTIVFTDKEELQNICKNCMIDYYKFIKYCNSINFEVKFEVVTERKNKGKCLEGYEIIDNTVCIPKDKVTSAIRKYCSKNNIKIIRS